MKILLVNKFHFIKGGSERYYFDLAENLKQHGHEVIFFAMQHEKNMPCAQEKYFADFVLTEKKTFNLTGIKSVLKLWWNFDAAKKINQLIQDEKPDLVHLHNISHQISPSILRVIKKYKLPTVMTMHDYKLACPNAKMFVKGKVCEKCQGQKYFNCVKFKCIKNSYLASLATWLEMTLHHKILKIYEKNIDLLIAPSEFLKNKMIAWGMPKEKVVHLPYFINTNFASTTTETKKENYVLFLGRLSEEKGIGVLIEAMQELPNIQLKVIGPGLEEQKIKTYLTAHNIKNIELLGYKTGKDLYKIISQSQCLIIPSIWYEVTGLVILEAYLNNTPVIGSDIGGIPEVVKDKETGYLFQTNNSQELTEKIKLIFKNYENQEIMAANGRKLIAENHDPEKHYQELLKIYQSL